MVTDFEWWRRQPGHYETPDVPPPPPPPPPATWAPWATLPTARYAHAAALVAGKLYVTGGNQSTTGTSWAGASTRLDVYDPAAGTWAALAAAPATGMSLCAFGAINGRLYGAGGWGGSSSNAACWEYDPATNAWTSKAPMPLGKLGGAGTGTAAGGVLGGKLYAVGGVRSGTRQATNYAYDPAANTWATLAPLPVPTDQHGVAVTGGKLYVIGGFTGSGSGVPTAGCWAYDPATNTWAAIAALPAGRGSPAVLAAGGKIYAIGGRGALADGTTAVYVYDPVTDAWAADAPAFPRPVHGAQAVVLAGQVIVLGGTAGTTAYPAAQQYPTDIQAAQLAPGETDPPPDPSPDPVWVPGAWEVDPDRSAGLISWSITYGRSDSTARVNPLTATVALAGHYAAPCPVGGERFRLALSAAVAAELGLTDDERVRFTGEVTDPVIDPRNPVSDVYTITAAGRLGRFRRRTVDGHTWPQERDGARVARILAAAGADAESAVDLGTRPLIPPVRKVTAGQLLDQTSDSTGGQLVEQLTGGLDWHSGEHRRGVPVTVTLDAGEILNDLTFEQHVGDILNVLELSYGREDQTVTVRDPGSINQRDIYDGSLSTALANAIDAHDLGLEIVGRRSEPVWQLPNLVVDLARAITSPAKRAQLLALRFGDRLKVTGLPAGAPYAGDVELYVEGTTETATPRAWRLSIAVSDPLLSGVGVRWADVDPALTWDGVDPALTWLDLARIENPADLTP